MEWISIKDQLPEIAEDVLIHERGLQEPYVGWRTGESWSSYNEYMDQKDITHWMPLPKPPQE